VAEFEEKLNAILGNQEAMGQIMALARSLSGEKQETPPPSQGTAPGPAEEAAWEPVESGEASPGPAPGPSAPPDLDPAMLQMGLKVVRELQGGDDRNAALLRALRPFLREEKRAGLDKALQIARMTRMIRAALGALGGREDEGRV